MLDLSNVTNCQEAFLHKILLHLIIAEEVTEVRIRSTLQIGKRKKKKEKRQQETRIERLLFISKWKPI